MAAMDAPVSAPVSLPMRLLTQALVVLAWAVLILFALIQIVPFVLTVANSFKCLPAVQDNPTAFIPVLPFGAACRDENGAALPSDVTTQGATFNPTLEGYERMSAGVGDLPRWTFNTFFVSVVVTLLRLVCDSMAGYALARLRFPGNRLIFFTMLGTMMIPGIVLIIPRFIILKELGMLDAYTGLIVPVMASAFGIFLMKQFFESIPGEIEEAAMVDGANRFIMFFRIVLPMATPALTALAIFSFQGTWNDFLGPLIVVQRDTSLWTLPLGLALLRGNFGSTLEWNTFLAGSVVTTVPLAIVFFIFQRYFVEGISYSGIKG